MDIRKIRKCNKLKTYDCIVKLVLFNFAEILTHIFNKIDCILTYKYVFLRIINCKIMAIDSGGHRD